MDFEATQTQTKIFSARIHYLLLISVGLLISNIFLVWFVGLAFMHQKRVVVPVTVTKPFTVSDYGVDSSYLQQMALTFVPLRLDLTADNVKKAHALLLQYVDPSFYPQFYGILNQEAKAIVDQKISSYFYISSITPDPVHLRVLIKGTLNRSVGSLSLAPTPKEYLIKFSYKAGILRVKSFSEVGENNNA